MSDHDLALADLLGETPSGPDPGFRIDVFARVSTRVRRRAAYLRAARQAALFAVIGLAFPAAQAAGISWGEVAPFAAVAGALGLAYVLALATIEGPRAVLARSRAALRAG